MSELQSAVERGMRELHRIYSNPRASVNAEHLECILKQMLPPESKAEPEPRTSVCERHNERFCPSCVEHGTWTFKPQSELECEQPPEIKIDLPVPKCLKCHAQSGHYVGCEDADPKYIPNVGLRTPDDPAAEKQLTCKYCGHPEHGGYCENVKPVPSDKISISRSVAEDWFHNMDTKHITKVDYWKMMVEVCKALKEQG